MQIGKASIKFEEPPVIESMASIVGKKEQAESALQKQTADLAIEKGDIRKKDIRYLFAGDLLGQLIATSFGTVDLEIPLFGLYGACSTMGEALNLGAMTVAAG